MIENVYTDELMCDIIHRAHLFFVFAWFYASFFFLFLSEKFACLFGSVCAFASGRRRPIKQPPVVSGDLFFLCDGRITPISQAKQHSFVSSSSSVGSSSTVVSSSSALPSLEVLSSSVGSSPCVLASPAAFPSPADVAFSSVFLSPFTGPSENSEDTHQSFFLRSAPVLSDRVDSQGYLLDFARVAGLPGFSAGSLPTIRQPKNEVSSGASFGYGCEAITQALLAAGVVPAPATSVAFSAASVGCPVAVGAPLAVSVGPPASSVLAPATSVACPAAAGAPLAVSVVPPAASAPSPVAPVAPCAASDASLAVAVSSFAPVVALSAASVAPPAASTLESGFSWSSFTPSVTGPFVFGSSVCSSLPALVSSGGEELVGACSVVVSAGPAVPVACSVASSLPVSSAGESFFAKLAADEDEYLDSLAEEINKLLDKDFDF